MSNHLFIGLRRRPDGSFERLTGSGVEQMIHSLGHDVGLQKRVTPHLFRHSYITWMITKGVNPVQVAAIVGHSSLDLIYRVYTHLSPSNANEAMIRALTMDDQH